jgi:hypothetical protein
MTIKKGNMLTQYKLTSQKEVDIFLNQFDKLPENQRLYMYGRKLFGYATYKFIVDVDGDKLTVYERI